MYLALSSIFEARVWIVDVSNIIEPTVKVLALVFKKLSLIVLFKDSKRLPIFCLWLRIQRWIQIAVDVGKEVTSDVLLTVTKSGMLKLSIDTGA